MDGYQRRAEFSGWCYLCSRPTAKHSQIAKNPRGKGWAHVGCVARLVADKEP